jgi:hypothetical protein
MNKIFARAAIGAAVAVGFAGIAQATVTSSTVTGNTTPSKLPKTSRGAATLQVAVDTGYDGACGAVCAPYATNTTVKFDNDFNFDTKGLATCNPQEETLAGPPAAAKAGPCKKALVGEGNATLKGAAGDLTATVVAFNGTKQAGKSRIILSSWVGAISTPAVLIGKLSPIHEGDLGWKLDVTVPPIAGGSEVITHFETTVHKTYKVKVRKHHKTKYVKHNYISARCHDANKLLDYQETTIYSDASTLSDTATQACTVK